jgi:hypothetical protein
MSVSDNDRIAYLSGEQVESLDPVERAELDELRATLKSPASWVEPADDLEDKVLASVAAEVASAPRQVRGSRRSTRPRLGFTRPRLSLAWAGVALAGVAAVIVAIVIATGSPTSGQAPLRFAMVVTGTPLAPNAHGSAELTKTASGWRIQLQATGLAHLENGRYYQAWVKNAAGILVPVGTFNDARKVTLWSGVPITKFRTLTVTIQVANGNPASSNRRVLVGTITSAK